MATVLPEPVWEEMRRSLPSDSAANTARWTRVRSSKPRRRMASSSGLGTASREAETGAGVTPGPVGLESSVIAVARSSIRRRRGRRLAVSSRYVRRKARILPAKAPNRGIARTREAGCALGVEEPGWPQCGAAYHSLPRNPIGPLPGVSRAQFDSLVALRGPSPGRGGRSRRAPTGMAT